MGTLMFIVVFEKSFIYYWFNNFDVHLKLFLFCPSSCLCLRLEVDKMEIGVGR